MSVNPLVTLKSVLTLFRVGQYPANTSAATDASVAGNDSLGATSKTGPTSGSAAGRYVVSILCGTNSDLPQVNTIHLDMRLQEELPRSVVTTMIPMQLKRVRRLDQTLQLHLPNKIAVLV